jgi:hypothetical protein
MNWKGDNEMSTYPWRIQADIQEGEYDPDVTVFLGDVYTNDVTGVKTLHRGTADPVVVKLSELTTFIADGMANGVTRKVQESVKPKE